PRNRRIPAGHGDASSWPPPSASAARFAYSRRGRFPEAHPRGLSPDMQNADQGEETARRGAVELDLSGKPLAQQVGALVVQAAPAHVDGLDLRGRSGPDGLIVAFADGEVVLDDAPEGREGENHLGDLVTTFCAHIQHQAVLDDTQMQAIGPMGIADRGEMAL